MKRKILTISIILTIILLIMAVVCYFLIKDSDPLNEDEGYVYDTSLIIDDIKFLKLNDYDAIKQYADEYPIYIQESDDPTIFAIGELYIKDNQVTIIYTLNLDGSINRFDGSYSMDLSDKSSSELQNTIGLFDSVVSDYFYVDRFEHNIYDGNGAPIDSNSEESYELMLNGKATYGLSVFDEDDTYWYITASVEDKKQINFEFFRCFDLSVYNDDSPNIDMREIEETGE